jgi:TRAP transporter 4TM/12TM fusion protein
VNANHSDAATDDQEAMKAPSPDTDGDSCLEYIVAQPRFSNATILAGLISVIGVAFSLFHLYAAYFGQGESYLHNTMHVSLVMILCVLLKPAGRKSWKEPLNKWFVADLTVIALIVAVQTYICWDIDDYIQRRGFYEPMDMAVGALMIVLVLETTRRAVGWVMAGLVIFFLLQATYGEVFFSIFYGPNIQWKFILNDLFMEEGGIYSIPITVSATYVVLFILFGAFVMRVGVGELFTDIAYALMGKQIGGPAKAAVLSSAFMSSISGSAVSNVATTGAVTIPMMKRMGYPPAFAAAVEACASTGGVFTPPVMGAVAFILAEFLGIPYWDVVKAAAVPAGLYFLSVLVVVHCRACKLNLVPKMRADLPTVMETLKRRGHLLIPLVILVGTLVVGYSPIFASVAGILSIFVMSWLRADTRLTPVSFLGAFEDAARMMVAVAVPSAAAGLIVGAIFYSGLAVRFSNSIIDLAQGSQELALVLAMVICILLGMGITVTALYILVAALVVPALIKLGVEPIAAHFFAFHFGVHSYITPPVALSAFAGAAIAGSDPMKTGVQSMRLGIAAYLIPYMFVYSTGLLWVGTWDAIVIAIVGAIIGVTSIACALEGWLMGRLNGIFRIILAAAALATISPILWLKLIGVVVIFGILGMRYMAKRADQATPPIEAKG